MNTYDLKMKKTIPSKEVLEQYIYDYGIDKTAQILTGNHNTNNTATIQQ